MNIRNLRAVTFRQRMMTSAIDMAGGGADPAAGTPVIEIPAGGGGGAADPAPAAGAAAKAWFESFADEQIRTDPTIQRHKGPEDLAKAHVALLKRFGVEPERRLDLPTDPNDAAAMREVWAKLGLPDKPEGYGISLDGIEGATEADKSMLAKFTAFAHEKGMPAGFAKAAFEFWTGESAAAQAAAQAQLAERKTAGEAALKTEFGGAFDTRMREIGNLLKTADPKGESGLTAENLAMYPGVTKVLANLVNRMAEPGNPGGNNSDPAGARMMTPSEAAAAYRTFQADEGKTKALHDRNNPGHAAAIKERNRLLAMKDGREPPE